KAADRAKQAKQSADAAEKSRLAAVAAQIEAKRNAEAEKRAALAQQQEAKAARDARDDAQKKEKLALEAVNTAIAKVGENRNLLYSSDVGLAQTAFEENDTARAQELLNRYTPATTKPFLQVGERKFEYDTKDLR